MIQYTVEAAQNSHQIKNIFLSSDDPEIIQTCKSLGLDVQYQRPSELAADETPMIDTILHGLEWWRDHCGRLPEIVMVLQPTCPLRTSGDIDGAIEMMVSSDHSSLVSVHSLSEHPFECVERKKEGWQYLRKPTQPVTRRQDYSSDFYFINGAIYLIKTDCLLSKKKLIVEDETALYPISPRNGLDIDDPLDLERAEYYLMKESLN
jgi:CMP-N,N'-diacetyllegionaminic acid synthase